VPRQRKPTSRRLPQPKVIRDSNPDFRINQESDSDVCRIAPKMLWIYYLLLAISPSVVKISR